MLVDHVGLCPADLEQSLTFYRDGVGLEVLADRTLEADLVALLGAHTGVTRTVFLGDPTRRDGGLLELLDTGTGAPPDGAAARGLPHRGLFLLSFVVDVDAVLARLSGLGLGGVPREMPLPGGRRAATVVDPDGVTVELLGQPVLRVTAPGRARPSVAVLGAGAGGLAAAVRLLRAGFGDLVVYEAGDGVGGTWRHNTYPGAASDVMSHLYSFSFALNPRWSRTYASQPELLHYFEDVAERFGVHQHLRTRARVERLRWDGARWEVALAGGEVAHHDVVVSALGLFSHAARPDVAGLDDFAGPVVHTSAWDSSLDLTGRRVGVVGTGASAVQVVPHLARAAAHLTVFQRTPAWMLPKQDKAYEEAELQALARPFAARRLRYGVWRTLHEGTLVRGDDPSIAQRQAMALAYLQHKVADPELRAKLTPDYPFGCKRVLLGGAYYAALQQPHVHLETSRLEQVTATGVRTADGTDHALDVLVLATGFETTRYLQGVEVVGRDGRRLHEEWGTAPNAYLGTTVSGFPNLFLLYGPNTNQGGNSVIGVLEAAARYAVSGCRVLRRDPRPLDVRPEVQQAYDAEVQARLRGSVWQACASYFRTDDGRIVTQWPSTSVEYTRRTWRLRPRDYARLPVREEVPA